MVQTATVNILAREFVMTTSSYLGTETGHLVLQLPHSVALVHRGGEVVLRADLLVLNTKHFSTNHRLKYWNQFPSCLKRSSECEWRGCGGRLSCGQQGPPSTICPAVRCTLLCPPPSNSNPTYLNFVCLFSLQTSQLICRRKECWKLRENANELSKQLVLINLTLNKVVEFSEILIKRKLRIGRQSPRPS